MPMPILDKKSIIFYQHFKKTRISRWYISFFCQVSSWWNHHPCLRLASSGHREFVPRAGFREVWHGWAEGQPSWGVETRFRSLDALIPFHKDGLRHLWANVTCPTMLWLLSFCRMFCKMPSRKQQQWSELSFPVSETWRRFPGGMSYHWWKKSG